MRKTRVKNIKIERKMKRETQGERKRVERERERRWRER